MPPAVSSSRRHPPLRAASQTGRRASTKSARTWVAKSAAAELELPEARGNPRYFGARCAGNGAPRRCPPRRWPSSFQRETSTNCGQQNATVWGQLGPHVGGLGSRSARFGLSLARSSPTWAAFGGRRSQSNFTVSGSDRSRGSSSCCSRGAACPGLGQIARV